jgi:ribonuclease HI
MQPHAIIYTDGGYRHSKDLGAWGFVIINTKNKKALARAQAFTKTTSNRMELSAVLEALKILPSPRKQVFLVSDSQYTINSCEKWIRGWKSNGWKKNTPGELKNIDILQELDVLISSHNIKYFWVRGHSGNHGNDYVDALLNRAMDSFLTNGQALVEERIDAWTGS